VTGGPAPAIEAHEVTRTYQLDELAVEALRGVSLTIQRADYLAIVGPSGSGKSTLMHLLGGLDRPTSGRLVIGGRDVATLSAPEMARLRNEVIGFVFQSFHLLPRTSAVDNVALPLVYRGVSGRRRRARAAEMLTQVGLAHRLGHRPNQLSGGEQQRVAIARALVTEPAVLLADEPTGNLDSATGESVLGLLESLNASSGVAVVLVTHDRDVAARAHRQIVMRDGAIVPSEGGRGGAIVPTEGGLSGFVSTGEPVSGTVESAPSTAPLSASGRGQGSPGASTGSGPDLDASGPAGETAP
jgi:putative ABC transport system ATP-binding protein